MQDSKGLSSLTRRSAVLQAMAEFDRIGRDAFLTKYGFGPARSYYLLDGDKRYDSKAIAAAAVGYEHPDAGPLRHDQFSGGERTVQARLEALGFTAKRIENDPKAVWSGSGLADLSPGDVLTNRQLMAVFKVSNSGGMRRSHETNTLVLISDYTKSLYVDEWHGNVLHYCGMGQKGDQRLDSMQNRTLAESETNGVSVHLFEVYEKNRYTYVGELELADKPYESVQDDVQQRPRRVWIFPLQLISGDVPAPPVDAVRQIEERQRKQARRMTDEEIAERARRNGGRSGSRSSTTTTYIRDQYVAEHARRRANGHCDLCKQPAPFKGKDGEPFLEVHHVQWLARGGTDTIDNTVALCPNCHRKMHILDAAADRAILLSAASA